MADMLCPSPNVKDHHNDELAADLAATLGIAPGSVEVEEGSEDEVTLSSILTLTPTLHSRDVLTAQANVLGCHWSVIAPHTHTPRTHARKLTHASGPHPGRAAREDATTTHFGLVAGTAER